MGWVVNVTLRSLYSRERDKAFIVQEVWWAQSWLGGVSKILPHWDLIPGLSSPYLVAIPTTLSRLILQMLGR